MAGGRARTGRSLEDPRGGALVLAEGGVSDLGGAVVPHGGGTHLLGPVAEVMEQGSRRR